eukprot:1580413-Alexandrium_andersonii.AAC.1
MCIRDRAPAIRVLRGPDTNPEDVVQIREPRQVVDEPSEGGARLRSAKGPSEPSEHDPWDRVTL